MAKRKGEKFNAKLRLIKAMYEKGYTKDEVIALFDFIDWILELSAEEEDIIREEIRKIEGLKNMPYVNSIKRWAMQEGMQKGRQEGRQEGLQQATRDIVIEVLDERFGKVPPEIVSAVNKIEELDKLKLLGRLAARCESLQDFAKSF